MLLFIDEICEKIKEEDKANSAKSLLTNPTYNKNKQTAATATSEEIPKEESQSADDGEQQDDDEMSVEKDNL